MSLFGNPILARGNRAGAVTTMSIAVYIYVVYGNGLSPERTTLKLFMIEVDTGIDDIDINAFSTIRIKFILGKSAESQFGTMTDPCEALIRESEHQ